MNSSFKIVLVGHFGVGKSSLIRRFVKDEFTSDYKVTIGVHILKKELEINDLKVTFVIWDIEGKEDLKKVRSSYLLGTTGFIYVVDPTRSTTYENIKEEVDFCKTNFPKAKLVTVVNKVDLIDPEEFEKTIDFKIDYFTSAKNNQNVLTVFNHLGVEILDGK